MPTSSQFKRLWLFEHVASIDEIHASAQHLLDSGAAGTYSLDTAISNPESPYAFVLHLYAPRGHHQTPNDSSIKKNLLALGGFGYSMDERLAFDRSPAGPLGPLRLGTQIRRSGTTHDAFREHWDTVHRGHVVARMPGVVRYVQSLVLECEPNSPLLDGIYESTLRSEETLSTALYSDGEARKIVEADSPVFLEPQLTQSFSVERKIFAKP